MNIDANDIIESLSKQNGQQARQMAVQEATILAYQKQVEALENKILELESEQPKSDDKQ